MCAYRHFRAYVCFSLRRFLVLLARNIESALQIGGTAVLVIRVYCTALLISCGHVS